MRIGLKSTDLINSDSVIGAYHPAFGSKVKSEAMKENMLTALSTLDVKSEKIYATFYSNPKSFSDLIGYRSSNKNWFKENYPAKMLQSSFLGLSGSVIIKSSAIIFITSVIALTFINLL